MTNLRIEFARLKELKGINLDLETFANLSIYFDDELLNSPWVRDKKIKIDYTDTEYLLSFFHKLLPEAKQFDEKEHSVEFMDDPLQFQFKRIGDKVRLKFGSGENITGRAVISYIDFLDEVLRVT